LKFGEDIEQRSCNTKQQTEQWQENKLHDEEIEVERIHQQHPPAPKVSFQ